MLLAKGTVLGKRWEVQEVVGEGACGKVYAVKSSTGATFDFPLVAKVIPTSVGTGKAAVEQKRLCDTLNYENTLFIGNLCEFSFRPCIPDIRTFHGVDAEHGVRYLVMERFERDLVGFASHSKPTNQSVANIGLQLLEGLHWMHKKGLLFIDVKPDNFMLNGDRIKFVDYGLVERWVSAMGTGSKVQQVRTMAGTPSFASLDVHNGSTPMRKDDLESMGLVLISLFLGGTLPWSDSKSDNECKKRKIDCDIKKLSEENDCPEIGHIILLCRSLVYDEKPDYDLYKSILEKMRDRKPSVASTVSKRAKSEQQENKAVTKKTKKEITAAAASAVTVAVSVVVVDKKSVKTVKSVAALNNVSIVNTGRKSARIGLLSPMHYTA